MIGSGRVRLPMMITPVLTLSGKQVDPYLTKVGNFRLIFWPKASGLSRICSGRTSEYWMYNSRLAR